MPNIAKFSMNVTTAATPHHLTSLGKGDIYSKWLASMVITFVLTFFLTYTIFALSYYGYKNSLLICCGGPSLSKKEKKTATVYLLILTAAVTTFVYVATAVPLVFSVKHPYCAIQHRVQIAFYALSLVLVYFALWYRVYTTFYDNPLLAQVTTTTLRVVNFSSMGFLAVLMIVDLTLFYLVPPYETTAVGCKHVQSKDSSNVKWIVLALTTIAFQSTLLFSFIYPLTTHRRNMLNRGFDSRTIYRVMKRGAVVAGVCIASDLINTLFAVVYSSTTTHINHIVYSLNLLINLMSVILSFSDWKEKLVPFGCIEKLKVEISSSTAMISHRNATDKSISSENNNSTK